MGLGHGDAGKIPDHADCFSGRGNLPDFIVAGDHAQIVAIFQLATHSKTHVQVVVSRLDRDLFQDFSGSVDFNQAGRAVLGNENVAVFQGLASMNLIFLFRGSPLEYQRSTFVIDLDAPSPGEQDLAIG